MTSLRAAARTITSGKRHSNLPQQRARLSARFFIVAAVILRDEGHVPLLIVSVPNDT
jgi:hypothetical protein